MASGDEQQPKIFPLYDGHEQRLQRVEATQQEMVGQLATCTAEVRNIGSNLNSSVDRIMERIDLAVKPLAQRLEEHIDADAISVQRVAAVEEAQAAHNDRLKTIEEVRARRAARWDGIRKLFIPAIAAAIGIGAKELIAFILRHA